MKRLALEFVEPLCVEVLEESVSEPADDQVLVRTEVSAISSGTEMLVFKGLVPEDLSVDETLPSLPGDSFAYPLRYGYSCAGHVVEAGAGVDPWWVGRPVFALHPHVSHVTARPGELVPVPEGMTLDDAVFAANMETAVNLILDGQPLIGEKVVVMGQGVVGLLTAALLAMFPLDILVCVDPLQSRRDQALTVGADMVLGEAPVWGAADSGRQRGTESWNGPADLVFELTGRPQALDQALQWCGFHSRVVIGSWYGTQTAAVNLGGRFHRDRVRMLSSQVSTINPELRGRWDISRRMRTAMDMIQAVRPSRLISHRFPIRQAQQAYEQVAGHPGDTLQVVLEYGLFD